MVTFTLFICLIQIQNTEICTANQPKMVRYDFLLLLPSHTLKKRAFGNILLDAPSCGLREAKIFFSLLNLFLLNLNIIHIL